LAWARAVARWRGRLLSRSWASAEARWHVFGLARGSVLTRKIAVAFLGWRVEACWMTLSRKRALPRFN